MSKHVLKIISVELGGRMEICSPLGQLSLLWIIH